MDRRVFLAAMALPPLLAACAGGGSTGAPPSASGVLGPSGRGWTTLIDGSDPGTLAGWSPLGVGRWSVAGGAVQGLQGRAGFLVSADSYTDFELRAEFWADAAADSGLFLRCQDRRRVAADNSHEVEIADWRPDTLAVDRWSTLEVSARGERIAIARNGHKVAERRDQRFRSGPIALQSAGGTIRVRRLQIRTL